MCSGFGFGLGSMFGRHVVERCVERIFRQRGSLKRSLKRGGKQRGSFELCSCVERGGYKRRDGGKG